MLPDRAKKLWYVTQKIDPGLIGQHKILRIDLYAAMLSKPRLGLDAKFFTVLVTS